MIFNLVHDEARRRAIVAVSEAPQGWRVKVEPPKRTLEQNAFLHSLLNEVSQQVKWHGQSLSPTVWKRLFTAAWLREEGGSPQLIPALDGKGVDVIYEKTSELSTTQCSSLIEWILAFGAEHGTKFATRDVGYGRR